MKMTHSQRLGRLMEESRKLRLQYQDGKITDQERSEALARLRSGLLPGEKPTLFQRLTRAFDI